VDKVLNNFFIDWGKLEKLSKGEFLSTIWNHVIQGLPKGLCVAQATDFLGVNQVIHMYMRTLTITTNFINSLTIKLKCARPRCQTSRPAGRFFGQAVLDWTTWRQERSGSPGRRQEAPATPVDNAKGSPIRCGQEKPSVTQELPW